MSKYTDTKSSSRIWLNLDRSLPAYAIVTYEDSSYVDENGVLKSSWHSLNLDIADCSRNITLDFSVPEKQARWKLAKLRKQLDLVESHLDKHWGT